MKNALKNWEDINERLITIELDVLGNTVVLIAIYASNDDANADIKNKMTNLLDDIGN